MLRSPPEKSGILILVMNARRAFLKSIFVAASFLWLSPVYVSAASQGICPMSPSATSCCCAHHCCSQGTQKAPCSPKGACAIRQSAVEPAPAVAARPDFVLSVAFAPVEDVAALVPARAIADEVFSPPGRSSGLCLASRPSDSSPPSLA